MLPIVSLSVCVIHLNIGLIVSDFLAPLTKCSKDILFQLMSTRAAFSGTVNYSTVFRSVHSVAGQQSSSINSRCLEHWTDCLNFLSSFDIIFRERNIFDFILNFTMQQVAWTLDWLSQIACFLWRQVWRKQCVSLHLLLSVEKNHLNIWLIVSESLVSLTSCLKKETSLTSSLITQ